MYKIYILYYRMFLVEQSRNKQSVWSEIFYDKTENVRNTLKKICNKVEVERIQMQKRCDKLINFLKKQSIQYDIYVVMKT